MAGTFSKSAYQWCCHLLSLLHKCFIPCGARSRTQDLLAVQVYGNPKLLAATAGHPGKLAALTSTSHVVTWGLSHQGLCDWPVPTRIHLQGCEANSLACNADGSQARSTGRWVSPL